MRRLIINLIIVALCVAFATTIVGCGKSKNHDEYSKGLEYEINEDGTATLVGIGSCIDQIIIIPSKTEEGNDVVRIGAYAFKGEDISGVVIPESVISIDNMAFFGCMFLTDVSLPDTIQNIGVNAFGGCRIVDLNIPENILPYINPNAFWGCRLMTINGEDSLEWLDARGVTWVNIHIEEDILGENEIIVVDGPDA